MEPQNREMNLNQPREVMLMLLVILASIAIIVGVVDVFQIGMPEMALITTNSIGMDVDAAPQFEMAALRTIDSDRNGAVVVSIPEDQEPVRLRDNSVIGIERLARTQW